MRRFLPAAVLFVAVMLAAPASAHPFGAPPVARIDARGHDVVLTWTAAADDWAALAGVLGALPHTQTFAFDAEGGVEQVDGATVTSNLAGNADLAAYATERLVVRQGEGTCPVRDVESDAVVAAGVTLHYRCPEAIGAVILESTMLHDVHPAYRTLVRTAAGDATLLTGQRPEATVTVARSSGAQAAAPVPGPSGVLEGRLLDAFDRAAGSGVAVAALFVALATGAMHALAPGHGKSLAAAVMLADRGRLRRAGGLGLSVAAMHTASTAVLAAVLAAADSADWLAAVTGWLSICVGVGVAATGVLLLRRARTQRHEHVIGPHSLLSLGLAGGLLPSPTAMLLLVAGLLSGRAIFALVLVTAFGLGMAATITVVGVSARAITAAPGARRLAALAPVLGAAGVTLAGIVYAANGWRSLV